ncbi:MAG: hypothetical protein QGG42_05055 [Phycisphaerae bacterium]|nr:hypothetical protein [Phycisphaerae bacterium]
MIDMGENPPPTTLSTIWKLTRWCLVIFVTWAVGLYLGVWIGSGILPPLWWVLVGPWTSLVAWLLSPVILMGLGTSAIAYCLPMKIESRKLAIGAAAANLIVWMFVGAAAL